MKKLIEKIFFYSFGRTWDGKNKKSIRTHEINIVLFNFLRINPQWRSFEDEKLYIDLRICLLFKDCSIHYTIFHLRIYPKFTIEFGEIGIKIKSISKQIWNWKEIRKIKNEIKERESFISDIYDDPMCGCPEDFCEDYGRKIRRLEEKLYELSV